jgi:hypothetical protein
MKALTRPELICTNWKARLQADNAKHGHPHE